MIIFSAIVPHPPILIPLIGKDNAGLIKKTAMAMQKLADDLYSLKPDAIVVISPHGELDQQKMTINQSPLLKADFKQFGDMVTELEFKGDLGLAYKINEYFETKKPLKLIHEERLDHGVSVPLFYLMKNLKQTKVIPINYSNQTVDEHFMFGINLGRLLKKLPQRIGVVASGDLSHRLTKDAPAGYEPQGKKFDHLLLQLLKEKRYEEIVKMDVGLIEKAGECAMRSICVLLGVINEMELKPNVLSYEGPFGVGYSVVEFLEQNTEHS